MATYNAQGICSSNVLRSPMFAAVMNYAIDQMGKKGLIVVSSAGIGLDDATLPLQAKLNNFRAALVYRLLDEETNGEVERLVDDYFGKDTDIPQPDRVRIEGLFPRIRLLVHGRLSLYRDLALRELGFPLKYLPKTMRNPFAPSGDLDLIVTMDGKYDPRIAQAYREARLTEPKIRSYGTLMDREDVKDDIAGGLAEAVRIADSFMEDRELVVGKMLEVLDA